MFRYNLYRTLLCNPVNNVQIIRNASKVVYCNRNPRNLELLGLAQRTKGWAFQAPNKDYCNKVIFEKTSTSTAGYIMHNSRKIIVSATTAESSIRKNLYSCVDVSAAINIGRILAYRCQQIGLTEVFCDKTELSFTNESVKGFFNSLSDNGVKLEEMIECQPPEPVGIDYDALTDEEKRSLYPNLIEQLRTVPDWDNIPYPYSLRPKAGRAKLKNEYQILSKVRQGMVWDRFYSRMLLPRNKAYWQHISDRLQAENLENQFNVDPVIPVKSEEVEKIVPNKWQID